MFEQALHKGLNERGRQMLPEGPTPGASRGDPAGLLGKVPSSFASVGTVHVNVPLIYQQGSSAPLRARGISGGITPNLHVIGPIPNPPVASSHEPAGAPLSARG